MGGAGAEVLANTITTNTQADVDVAGLGDGTFVVTWCGNGAGDADVVFARRFKADGTAIGSEFMLNVTTTGVQTLPAVGSDGSFIVAWQGQDSPDTLGVYVRTFAAHGTGFRNASSGRHLIPKAMK